MNDDSAGFIRGDITPPLAWWSGTLGDFFAQKESEIIERLALRAIESHSLNYEQQIRAWRHQIRLLRAALANRPQRWRLLVEYPLLRLGRRLDAVLVTECAVFVLEFKIGSTSFDNAALRQVEDYALDLHYFHAGSRDVVLIPVLIASNAKAPEPAWPLFWHRVSEPLLASEESLSGLLSEAISRVPNCHVDIDAWERAPYRPVPTIIEAAKALYQRHGVDEIRTARADMHNLNQTTQAIRNAISKAKRAKKFIILFVTGIPGAGKTLCGLDVVFSADTDACFLTGTLPMVYVLNAALGLDAEKSGRSKRNAARETQSKIQSVNGFLKHYITNTQDIPEHVIVFDEAQRAWDEKQGANSPFKLASSEASIILDIMRRHQDYAVVVGLVGNGQEINTGEAGLAEWGNALSQRPEWEIRAAPIVLEERNDARLKLFTEPPPNMSIDNRLHLDIAVRNVVTSSAALWVDAVLRGESSEARAYATKDPPFFLTRSLEQMRHALRAMARGERRAGLVCSSGAKRLVAEGIWPNFEHLKKNKVADWFLKKWPDDIRASGALELPATEFACQGLELDYVGLCWGGDLIWRGRWEIRRFVGPNWNNTKNPDARAFRINAYRVLLTRARYATVIWVPKGDARDKTRRPETFDQTAEFLLACGAVPLEQRVAEIPSDPTTSTLL